MLRMPRCSFVTVALPMVIVSGVAAPTVAARAQHAPGPNGVDPSGALSARDSLRILRDAHDAQFHFEVFRRQELPRTPPEDVPTCEMTIGRMCYWTEPEHEEPIPEPGSIRRARAKLVATLARLAERSRADPWIAGERVRYLVESGDDSAAAVAARECWAAKWWCGALLGFALHSGGHYEEAEAAFDSALAAMPHDERCRWTDISLLLDDDERDAYLKLPCDARDSTEKRFWALAQPSYVVRGNDRRTEHFSRYLLAELSKDAENAYGMTWGDDLRELMIRYGQSTWYTTTWPDPVGRTSGAVGHDREPSYHFAAIRGSGDSVHWDVRVKGARERYSPPYIDSLVDLDAQFAMMKRGDSALVVVVYADSIGSAHTVLGVASDAPVARVAGDTSLAIRIRRARAAWRGIVAGVEWYDPAHRRDSRARTWLAPPVAPAGAPALSTLLFFAGDTASSVSTLDQALEHALTANELRAGERMLGLYWEVYGTTPGRAAPSRAAAPAATSSPAPPDSARRDSTVHDSTVHDSTVHDSTTRDPAVRGATVRDSTPSPARDSVDEDSTRDGSIVRASPDSSKAHPRSVAGDTTSVDDGAELSITVARIDGGIFSRLGQALRIVPRVSPVAMQWHDAQIGDGIAARSVVLNLSQLPPGKYRITLAAGPDAQHRTVTSREIRLR
jgi:hypothetical protein